MILTFLIINSEYISQSEQLCWKVKWRHLGPFSNSVWYFWKYSMSISFQQELYSCYWLGYKSMNHTVWVIQYDTYNMWHITFIIWYILKLKQLNWTICRAPLAFTNVIFSLIWSFWIWKRLEMESAYRFWIDFDRAEIEQKIGSQNRTVKKDFNST